MPTNKQRREAARRHLERQLQRRQEREARQRRVTVITSIVATLVLIGAVVVAVVALGSGDGKKKTTATKTKTPTATASVSPSPTAAPVGAPKACAKPSKAASVTFNGVTVKDPTNLKKAPQATSTSTKDPTALECQDLVIGTGAAATPTSNVTVQYTGLLYKTGTKFEASWDSGSPAQFSLTGVVPGFTQGIGGQGKVAPMKVGGRRIMILPAALAYGTTGSGKIPPNTPLVFIVDLTKVG